MSLYGLSNQNALQARSSHHKKWFSIVTLNGSTLSTLIVVFTYLKIFVKAREEMRQTSSTLQWFHRIESRLRTNRSKM